MICDCLVHYLGHDKFVLAVGDIKKTRLLDAKQDQTTSSPVSQTQQEVCLSYYYRDVEGQSQVPIRL